MTLDETFVFSDLDKKLLDRWNGLDRPNRPDNPENLDDIEEQRTKDYLVWLEENADDPDVIEHQRLFNTW